MSGQTDELKPCPFCGRAVELRRSAIPRSVGFQIKCEGCGVSLSREASAVYEAYTLRFTIAAWNARAALQPARQDAGGGE